MAKGEMFILAVAAIYTLIFCGVGILFRKVDIFSKLNHPLVKKYPNISKLFGTVFACGAQIWFFLVISIVLINHYFGN